MLALLVVGIGPLVNALLGVLRRDRERGSLAGVRRPRAGARHGDVAVVITAHDAEADIADAIASATRMVAAEDVYVVSDDSTDRTAALARDLGVNVVETAKPLGRAAAATTALDGFHLVDEYDYALLLDVDHRPHPAYLDRTLPMFDDPEVVAIAGFARTDWTTARRTPFGALLTAFRARANALTQALLTIIRTRPNGEAARLLPSPARMFRTSVLTDLDLAPEGLATADFDVSNQVYRKGLGRIVVVRGAVVSTRDPDTLVGYVRQVWQWSVGFWQAVRRNGLRRGPQVLGLGWFAVESAVTSVVLVALPFLVGFGLQSVWSVLLGVWVPDLLLTALVAARHRQPRFLAPALFLPFVRLLDAVLFLAALPHAFVERAARSPWLSPARTAAPEPAGKPWWRWWPVPVVGWVAAAAAAAGLAHRVSGTAAALPATATEPGLVDAVFGRVAGFGGDVPEGLAPATAQFAGFGSLASSFDRHASVLTGVRELSVVCAVVIALGLLVATAVLRLHPLAAALATAAVALCPPALVVLAGSGAGPLAAAWLAVAAVPLALATRIGWKALPIAVIPVAGAVVTAPALVIPFAVATAAWWVGTKERLRDRKRVAVAAGVLAVGAGLALLLGVLGLLAPAETSALTGSQRAWLLTAGAVLGLGGLVRLRSRTGAAGLLATAATSAVLGSDVLLAVVLAGSVLVLTALVDGLAERRPARRAAMGLAAAAGLAVVVAGVGAVPPTAPPVDHAAAADWFLAAAAPGATLSAPPLLLSDLRRDLRGRAPQLVRPEGEYTQYAVGTGVGAGVEVARFAGLTLRLLDTGPAQPAPDRTAAGAQLADNPRIRATQQVRDELRAGRVDFRAMAVLAEISAQHELVVGAVLNPAAEQGSGQPLRTVVVDLVDGRPAGDPAVLEALRTWVTAQRSPYAPSTVRPLAEGGAALDWRIPNPGDPAPR
ncbi:hypothetical protein BJP25_25645 [Actinokineospora bangkokensis]|uniref:Glycosyltransferase 2-like domain-containing protein n=1 Tax=Actinokineospora bangkokensis TaxID=1193682 RepID=A0A1Q9LHQ0_9PSEU|nr:hypothetical protein BJP25_25645 [Actinokineospora bangkokensis]